MTTHCNCNGNLIPSGNDFYLAIALKSRSLVDGEVVETPFDFEAADTYNARIYGILDGTTLSTMVGLKDGSTDTVIIDAKGVPLIRAIGVEVTGEVDGRSFRAAEKGFISIVEFNGEAHVVFTPVTGGQEANLVMTLTFLPSAAVVGKNAYEIWKEEPGNQDKTLADFIYFLGHGESAYEIAVRYGYTGTEAEYNMLYFDAVDVANTAGQNAQQAADTANEMAAQAQDAAELADAATTNANNAATAAAAAVDAAIDNMEDTLNAAIAAQDAEIASKEAEIDAEFAIQTALINQKQMEIGAVPSDLTPTRGSTNWVVSDGLAYSKLGNSIDFSKLYSAPFYLYNGKWNSNNGVNIFVKHINVYAGEKYCIVANSSLKADLRFMSTYYPVANAAATWTRQFVEAGKTEVITIPEGCNYLVFQDDHAQSAGSTILPDTVYKIEDDGINSTLNKHTEEISQLQDVSTVYETLAVYGGGNALNANKLLIVNGTLYSQNNYYSSDFIEIPSEATNVVYSGMMNNYHDNSCGFMLADSNYNVIWFATDTTSGNGNIDLTNYTNAVYFRFCHASSSNCYVRFEKRRYNTGDTSLKRGGDNVVINDGIAKMIPHIEENYYELEVNRCLVVADSTAQNFGELAPNTNTGSYYRASSYIYVEGATVIKNLVCVTKSNDSTLYGKAGYVFYDAEKTPISGVVTVSQGNYAQETRDVIVPDNAVYFRHTFNVTSDLIRITIEFKESENSLVVSKRDCDDLFKGDIIKTDVYRNTLEQLAWYSNPISGSGYKHKPLNLLHFSDIHGDGVNLSRIIEFKNKYSNYIDDVLHTGDSINLQWSDTHQFDFWLNTEGSEYILNTIGNHDTYNGSNWYAKTAAESYATYISPFVSNWDVEASENLCYYYKDYSDRGVRLIVIDVMHWDATQLSWLETTLAGAKTNSLHVIIAGHAPAGVASNGNKECNFDYFAAQHNLWEVDEPYGHMDASVSQAVNTFIQGGGVFICYLCGHVHTDLFRRLDAYPEQYYITVTLGACIENVGDHAWGCVSRHTGFRSQDLFNIITIDVANNLLTITRIGNEYDRFGRHQGGLLWDYGTREILFQY